jgi:hypothetical protein
MSGYRSSPDDDDSAYDKVTAIWEVKTFAFLLLAPGVLGAALLIAGITSAAYIEAAVGLLLLASAPFVARWACGKIEGTFDGG